ncbi:MAG: GNAT family N-acetyltransferase [Bacteroidia bacterium]|nr:GNAT family N-acetyltransferase [Bacteroidia bacterium]
METERQLYFPWLGYFALHGENIIGTGGFKNTPNQSRRSGHVEIAYEVFEEYRGQGLGKKICNKLVDLAKDQPLCHRLIALVDLDNHKSEKVLLSNGFSLERQVEEMDGNLSNLWSLQLEKEKLATSIIH